MKKIPMWFWEQLPAYILVTIQCVYAWVTTSLPEMRMLAIVSGVATLGGTKLMTIADREKEELDYFLRPLVGEKYRQRKVQCWRAKVTWSWNLSLTGIVAPILQGINAMRSSTPWISVIPCVVGGLLFAYRSLYGDYRQAYRMKHPYVADA